MSVFNLPELGEGLEEGEIVTWKVQEGGDIKADETLVEIMTDKATIEIPSPATGKVTKLYYKEGETARVGKPLVNVEVTGEVSAEAEPAGEVKKEEKKESSAPREESKKESPPSATKESDIEDSDTGDLATGEPTKAASSSAEKVLAAPAVRKMAREKGIDLTQVHGSGDRGRILKADLVTTQRSGTSTGLTLHAAESFRKNLEERIPYRGIRRKIGEHLSKSMQTAVHFNHFDEMDFSQVIKLRKEANAYAQREGFGVKVTFLPFYIKGAIAALKKFPILNSSLDEEAGEVVIKHYYHFGISVQTDNGLMVAVIRDCDKKSIFELAQEIKETADRARVGKASREDLTGSTITITNPGSIGGLYATPVINYPETVILGMYSIKKRPVVITEDGEDKIVARPMMYSSITCDHRVIDGAIAAGFMTTFSEYISDPGKIAFY